MPLSHDQEQSNGESYEEIPMLIRLVRASWLMCGVVTLSLAGAAVAQPWIYPNLGQSPQQQEFDRGQCYSWAVQQTGFDPANPRIAIGPPPPQSAPGPDGSMLRGAAGRPAAGAIRRALRGRARQGAGNRPRPRP